MLEKIMKIFLKIYKEKPKSIKKLGRPKSYSDKEIISICLVKKLKGLTEDKAVIRYLANNKKLCRLLGLASIPDRTTFLRRSRALDSKLRSVIRSIGRYYCQEYSSDYPCSSFDASLFEAEGPKWHKKYRRLGILPDNLRGVDRESSWGYSPTKGWVQGYKGHFNVAFPMDLSQPPFPIDTVVTKANVSDFKKIRDFDCFFGR